MGISRQEMKDLVSEIFKEESSLDIWEYPEEFDLKPAGEEGECKRPEEEEEIVDETSGMGAGAVAGSPSPSKIEDKLREAIRGILREVVEEQSKAYRIQENKLRAMIRTVIEEGKSGGGRTHQLTGINVLDNFLRDNIETIKDEFTALATSKEQRDGFRAQLKHSLINLFNRLLATSDLSANVTLDGKLTKDDFKVGEGAEQEVDELEEEGSINVKVVDDENPFIDVSDKPEKKEKEAKVPEGEFDQLVDVDPSGQKKALKVMRNIRNNLIEEFTSLSDERDIEAFIKYLLINIELYCDNWEGEMSNKLSKVEVEPDPEDFVDTGDGLGAGELGGEEEDGIPNDLQEEWDEAMNTNVRFEGY